MLVRKLFDSDIVQMVVPHLLRKPLFDRSHSGPLAAHLGAQRTFLQLRTAYYWLGMKGDVIRWTKECETCAQCNGPPTRRQGRLQKVLTGAPLDIVAVDGAGLCGGLRAASGALGISGGTPTGWRDEWHPHWPHT